MTDYLTVEQVAENLSVSPRFVYDELRRKNLRGIKLSGKAGWRVTPDDLETYVAAKANVSRVRRAS